MAETDVATEAEAAMIERLLYSCPRGLTLEAIRSEYLRWDNNLPITELTRAGWQDQIRTLLFGSPNNNEQSAAECLRVSREAFKNGRIFIVRDASSIRDEAIGHLINAVTFHATSNKIAIVLEGIERRAMIGLVGGLHNPTPIFFKVLRLSPLTDSKPALPYEQLAILSSATELSTEHLTALYSMFTDALREHQGGTDPPHLTRERFVAFLRSWNTPQLSRPIVQNALWHYFTRDNTTSISTNDNLEFCRFVSALRKLTRDATYTERIGLAYDVLDAEEHRGVSREQLRLFFSGHLQQLAKLMGIEDSELQAEVDRRLAAIYTGECEHATREAFVRAFGEGQLGGAELHEIIRELTLFMPDVYLLEMEL